MNAVKNVEPGKLSDQQQSERRELWDQLTRAITLRSNEDQVVWRIFAAFWAANAILLVALFRDGRLPDSSIVVFVACVGIGLSLTWIAIQMRALGHVARHEKLMDRIEQRLGVSPELAVSASINQQDYADCTPALPHARTVIVLFTLVVAGLWATALLVWGLLRG